MIMKAQKQRETFIAHSLNRGFENAAQSFSKIVNRNIRISTLQSLVIRHDTDFSYVSEGDEQVFVLITQLMGDFSGKSYLIFSQSEADEIFRSVASKGKFSDDLKEALLLEIDNILSASVISSISDSMNAVVYGDVPKLKKMHGKDLYDYFLNDASESNEHFSIVYSMANFRFDNHEEVHPQFIWKLSSRIFDLIPEEKAAGV
ncbi:hypothetical protein WSM22_41870 [Cytophagales bacterium WSM2-2]|nr:hypothetical protein WSM22_41870 [Cytophagales bacterium WSM2-2]